ncbi:hypothetical protein [Thalassomonas sp. M1454]|uniref:hypothetical protein n=1 Tax=Thalassomonas sp. M1454 TaxID=2594477 RepID=UPI00117DE916|nr:hypothetical protein [Thalassomonas sp. M1454]TRX53432.1 hypothetical protein FNN08_14255 [Thalassomonas sp. M1454]
MKINTNKLLKYTFILSGAFFTNLAIANDADEAAKELANPNTAFASLNIKPQYIAFKNENGEDFEETSLLFQPVLPFPRDDGSKIIVRPAITAVEDNGFGESGMKDISSDVFYALPTVVEDSIATIEGFGALFSLPTGSSDLGQGEVTSIGASYILGKIAADNIKLFFPQHLVSVDEGDLGNSGKVNLTTIQLGYIKLPGGGWNYGTGPKIKYNWEAESGEEWTVPLNFSIGKTTVLGDRPWKFSLEFDYFVVTPEPIGPEYQITFTITPVVQNTLANWF